MQTFSLAALRKQLYRVVDQILHSGIPVEIERNGRKLYIVPDATSSSKLSRLKRRHGIIGNPEELSEIKVGQWDELKNLS